MVMDRKTLSLLARVCLPVLLVSPVAALSQERPSNSSKIAVYKQNFSSLNAGPTQPFPGATNQDGWFSQLAVYPAYGAIEGDIALGAKALHEFTSSSLGGPVQTIDKRLITPPDLSRYPRITLQVNFYAHTSDLSAANTYFSEIIVGGGPHPGFEVLGFGITSGNGISKELAGVNVGMASFNGVDNNEPIFPTVARNLAWDTWHAVTLVVDQSRERYVSIEVDGRSEDLSAYSLPRSNTATDVWERGQLMETIQTLIVPNADFGGSSDDDIYWDNFKITVEQLRRARDQ
ncbi:MAG: hypothetical protein RL326_2200 [Pseudomonadota bacterium]